MHRSGSLGALLVIAAAFIRLLTPAPTPRVLSSKPITHDAAFKGRLAKCSEPSEPHF